jgi:hypothetical protein
MKGLLKDFFMGRILRFALAQRKQTEHRKWKKYGTNPTRARGREAAVERARQRRFPGAPARIRGPPNVLV